MFSTYNELPVTSFSYKSLFLYTPTFLVLNDFIQSMHITTPLIIYSFFIDLVNELMKDQRWVFLNILLWKYSVTIWLQEWDDITYLLLSFYVISTLDLKIQIRLYLTKETGIWTHEPYSWWWFWRTYFEICIFILCYVPPNSFFLWVWLLGNNILYS